MAKYIERDALLLDIVNAKILLKGESDWVTGYRDALQAMGETIQALPSADVVEVVHGRWEYLQDDEWRCSNCHTVFNTGGKWIPMTDNFCSECGADMRERRDDND